jgi:hypothetical protein
MKLPKAVAYPLLILIFGGISAIFLPLFGSGSINSMTQRSPEATPVVQPQEGTSAITACDEACVAKKKMARYVAAPAQAARGTARRPRQQARRRASSRRAPRAARRPSVRSRCAAADARPTRTRRGASCAPPTRADQRSIIDPWIGPLRAPPLP